ncbi:MAG: TonB-dependent receptor, partial [Ignavibacteriae bacterium]|nr:TonB-dependent receptor [Ignavibacteriota bacterium]
ALKSLAKLKLKYYHQNIDRNVEIMPNPMVTSNPQAEHINDGITIQSDWIFSNTNYFNAGIDYWQRKYEGLRTTNNKVQNIIKVDKPVPNSKFGSLGFFAQNEAKLVNQKLSLIIGGRYDLINISNEETKNPVYIINNGVKNTNVLDAAASYETGKETNKSFSGNLGILYKLTNEIDLTLNTAYTFRSPSLEERYQFIDLGGIVYLGNPNLKPEKGVSLDYGIRIWKEKFSVRANTFLNSLTNLVVDDIVTQDSLYKKNNVGKARLYGFDLSAEYNFINDNLFYLTAAFVRGEDLNKNEYLSEIPPLNGIFGLRLFLFNEIKLDVSANMFSSQTKVAANESKTGGYTTFDLSLQSNSINYFGAKFKLVTGIENIFDRAYRNHLSTYRGLNLLEPGRNIFAKIIIDFR